MVQMSDSLEESKKFFFLSAVSFIGIGLLLLAVLFSKGELKEIDLMYVFVLLGTGCLLLVLALSLCDGFMKMVNKEFYLFKRRR